jgi:hypothetical protein
LIVSLYPPDLLLAELITAPPATYLSSIDFSSFLLILDLLTSIWIYWQLRQPAVVDAYVAAGYSRAPPIGAFVVTALIFVLLGAGGYLQRYAADHSKAVLEAIQRTEAQVGPGCKFHYKGIELDGNHAYTVITAYNMTEVKDIKIESRQ